jgi:hypothetical protein
MVATAAHVQIRRPFDVILILEDCEASHIRGFANTAKIDR